ncbi:hypothetical protein D3C80_1330500 [compost metagenome]
MAVDARGVARPHIETCPGIEFLGVGLVDVLAAGIDGTSGQCDAFCPGDVPLGPQVGLHIWHTYCLVALVGGRGRIGQLAVQHSHATQQSGARRNLTKHAQLDATVTLLCLHRELVASAQLTAGFLYLEYRQGGHERVVLVLHSQLVLLGLVRRERFTGIARRGRCDITFAQAFDIVVVQRNVFPRLDHYACHGGGCTVFVARGHRTRGAVVA